MKNLDKKDLLVKQLQEKINNLEVENEDLRFKVRVNDELENIGLDEAKNLMQEFEDGKRAYESALADAKSARANYEKLVKEMTELKLKYEKEMKQLLAHMKRKA